MISTKDKLEFVYAIQVPDGYTNDWGKEGICVPA